MSSTYSTSLRIQLIDTATEDEAWGQPTDNNLGTVIEQAITGIDSISLTNLTSYTLTTANAAVDQARNAVLIFTGAPTGNCNVIAPSVQKIYVINNQTTGGYNVNIKTSSGNAAVINANASQLVFCDGTTFYTGIPLATVDGNLTVTGNIKLGGLLNANNGSLVMTANTSVVNTSYNTGAMILPIGTTAQRPSVGIAGMSRWNTSVVSYEIYDGVQWIALPLVFYAVSYLMVAGGGGGGGGSNAQGAGSGGGGGGHLSGTTSFSIGSSYTVTVGSGGGAGSGGITGTQGGNSTITGSGFTTVNSVGGGGGGGQTAGTVNGGSGGGGYYYGSPGSGVSGQGYAGGNGYGNGGGGGGGSAVGGTASDSGIGYGGAGGAGNTSSITGTAVVRSGGGGGGGGGIAYESPGGAGGSGGGGAGGDQYSPAGGPASNNTGSGGGGGYSPGSWGGGLGGSGIAVISYLGVQKGSGGTYTYVGGYSIHTFTSSGTYTA